MSDTTRDFDVAYMRQALEAATQARPSPNPPVGAVVALSDVTVVSRAFYVEAGEAHVEIAALFEVGDVV